MPGTQVINAESGKTNRIIHLEHGRSSNPERRLQPGIIISRARYGVASGFCTMLGATCVAETSTAETWQLLR